MTMQERLKLATEKFRLGIISSDELVEELRGFLDIFDDAYYREKIRGAIMWAEIYSDPQKWKLYSRPEYNGREVVRGFLLQELSSAADTAGKLREENCDPIATDAPVTSRIKQSPFVSPNVKKSQ